MFAFDLTKNREELCRLTTCFCFYLDKLVVIRDTVVRKDFLTITFYKPMSKLIVDPSAKVSLDRSFPLNKMVRMKVEKFQYHINCVYLVWSTI